MLQNNVLRYNVLHLYVDWPSLLQMTAFGVLKFLHETFDGLLKWDNMWMTWHKYLKIKGACLKKDSIC